MQIVFNIVCGEEGVRIIYCQNTFYDMKVFFMFSGHYLNPVIFCDPILLKLNIL